MIDFAEAQWQRDIAVFEHLKRALAAGTSDKFAIYARKRLEEIKALYPSLKNEVIPE